MPDTQPTRKRRADAGQKRTPRGPYKTDDERIGETYLRIRIHPDRKRLFADLAKSQGLTEAELGRRLVERAIVESLIV